LKTFDQLNMTKDLFKARLKYSDLLGPFACLLHSLVNCRHQCLKVMAGVLWGYDQCTVVLRWQSRLFTNIICTTPKHNNNN